MADTDATDTLVVYADFVCPFCYLGKASLEAYLDDADTPPGIDWRPFDLRSHKRGPDGAIDHGIDDGKDDAYFEQVRENVERLSERYGVDMSLDHAREVDSWNAQLAMLAVEADHDAETVSAFRDAVFDALWLDSADIGDTAVLQNVATSVGIDEAFVRDALADDALDAELRDRFRSAHDVGITAVPTFVYGEHAARGAVPPAQLRRLVEGA